MLAKYWIFPMSRSVFRTLTLQLFYYLSCRLSHLWLASATNRELKQPQRWRQQQRHNFLYLAMKNNSFARLLCTCNFSLCTFRHHSRSSHEVKWPHGFAVVWKTWAYIDKCSILSSYLWSAGSNLIPGYFEYISQAQWLNNWDWNDCRNAKFHSQTTSSLSSTPCLLKLPNLTEVVTRYRKAEHK